MKKTGSERRLHPRLQQKLPFKVEANGYDFSTTTENISCLGAYCSINKYVPPFTRVAVKLTLPIRSRNGEKNRTVDCQGTIVRTVDKDKNNFNIAIFFNRINNSQRKIITEYINQFLPQAPAAATSPNIRWGK